MSTKDADDIIRQVADRKNVRPFVPEDFDLGKVKPGGIIETQPNETIDYVNHPPHYTAHPSGVECITITEWMNFNLGNTIKYIWRADTKGATIEDLEKARWYLEREIDRLRRLSK